MQAEIIIFILTCLAVAAGLVFVTYWLTRARWRERMDVALKEEQAVARITEERRLDRCEKLTTAAEATARALSGHREGKRILACEIAKAYNQKEVLGLALAVSHRGRVRVRIVDGDGGHHLLLHSPAGYKNKARASEILERIQQARLLRVEDITQVTPEEEEAL